MAARQFDKTPEVSQLPGGRGLVVATPGGAQVVQPQFRTIDTESENGYTTKEPTHVMDPVTGESLEMVTTLVDRWRRTIAFELGELVTAPRLGRVVGNVMLHTYQVVAS